MFADEENNTKIYFNNVILLPSFMVLAFWLAYNRPYGWLFVDTTPFIAYTLFVFLFGLLYSAQTKVDFAKKVSLWSYKTKIPLIYLMLVLIAIVGLFLPFEHASVNGSTSLLPIIGTIIPDQSLDWYLGFAYLFMALSSVLMLFFAWQLALYKYVYKYFHVAKKTEIDYLSRKIKITVVLPLIIFVIIGAFLGDIFAFIFYLISFLINTLYIAVPLVLATYYYLIDYRKKATIIFGNFGYYVVTIVYLALSSISLSLLMSGTYDQTALFSIAYKDSAFGLLAHASYAVLLLATIFMTASSVKVSLSNGLLRNVINGPVIVRRILLSVVVVVPSGIVTVGALSMINASGNTLSGPLSATNVYAGDQSTCALTKNGYVYCWGDYKYGSMSNSYSPEKLDTKSVSDDGTVQSMSMSKNVSCLLNRDSEAYCWGSNDYGELGIGTTNRLVDVPTAVIMSGALSGKTIKQISPSFSSTCAVASDEFVYCWGSNHFGSLGDGTNNNSTIPVGIDSTGSLNGKTVKSLIAGVGAMCVIASDDQAYCWGFNIEGSLGSGSGDDSNTPIAVKINDLSEAAKIEKIAMGREKTCAISTVGQLYCWGKYIKSEPPRYSANIVTLDSNRPDLRVKDVAIGDEHVCAVSVENNIYCWGINNKGQLGDGSEVSKTVPVMINKGEELAMQGILSITAGGYHTCVSTDNYEVYCWGGNMQGQLGIGKSTEYITEPQLVIGTGE